MLSPRRKKKPADSGPSPEDTQEMFTAGQSAAEDPEETKEHETVAPETGITDDEEPAEIEAETEVPDEEAEDTEDFEEEIWEEEDEEWEEDPEYEEPEPEESGSGESGEDERKPSRGEDLKVWFTEFRVRSAGIGKRLLKRVGDIKLPNHEIDGQKVLAVAGILAIALLVGGAGYVIGKGSGDDLDTARLEGEFAGKREGAVAGATRGYAAGFKKGRDVAFRKSYSASYRRNYRRAYESAGMDPPKAKNIEVPKP